MVCSGLLPTPAHCPNHWIGWDRVSPHHLPLQCLPGYILVNSTVVVCSILSTFRHVDCLRLAACRCKILILRLSVIRMREYASASPSTHEIILSGEKLIFLAIPHLVVGVGITTPRGSLLRF